MSARDRLLDALIVERYTPPPGRREARPDPPEFADTPERIVARRRAAAAEMDGVDPKPRRRRRPPVVTDEPAPDLPAAVGDDVSERDRLRRLMPGRTPKEPR